MAPIKQCRQSVSSWSPTLRSLTTPLLTVECVVSKDGSASRAPARHSRFDLRVFSATGPPKSAYALNLGGQHLHSIQRSSLICLLSV